MSESNFIAGSSRRNRETSRTDSGDTTRKAGRKPSSWSSTTESPNFALTASKIAFGSKRGALRLRREISFLLDDLLELEDPVDERLGAGGAAGDVDVDREEKVHPLDHAVRVLVEGAARVGAGSHPDHVLGLGHLFVQPYQPLGHLVRDGPGDDHQVRLPRGRPEDGAEPVEVVPGGAGLHQLDAT